jgi:uncharacterized protein YhaN
VKLRILELVKFGSFTGRTLDFGTAVGLSVVYGKNEAGKSTARRAVLGLLYGIPENTHDDHLHAGSDLAVGAVFVGKGNKAVRLTRRKKRKDSLRDASDVPVPESVMVELLGGVERPLFSQLFCFGHQELAEGAQALLDGKGDAGQSLFDAGTGGAPIHGVLARLDAEAEALYRPRGRNPKLNQALDEYRSLGRAVKDAMQSPEKWQEQKRALDELEQARAQLETRRDELKREQQRLGRVQRALPIASRYSELYAKRATLGNLPTLPQDAAEQSQRALDTLRDSTRDLEECARRAARRADERGRVGVDDAVLGAGKARIQELGGELAIRRNADGDLRKRMGELGAAEADALAILVRLGRAPSLDGVEALRLGVAEQSRIQELDRVGSEIQGRLKQVERQWSDAAEALNRHRVEEPASTSDPEPLRRAILTAQRSGDLDARGRQLSEELAAIEPALALALARLAPWKGDATALASLALPSRDTTQHFEAAERRLTERKAELGAELEVVRKDAAAIERAIAALEGQGSVPDEQALRDARARRDAGWALVRRAWGARDDVEVIVQTYDAARPLGDAYLGAVTEADEVSDRLRREAERVAELAERKKGLEQALAARAEIAGKLESLAAEQASLKSEWNDVWTPLGIEPRAPASMRDWLARAEPAVALSERRAEVVRQLASVDAERAQRVASLTACSNEPERAVTHSLSEALDRALEELEQMDQTRQSRESGLREKSQLEQGLRRLSTDRDALRQQWGEWKTDWARAVERLGLGPEPAPSQVSLVLAELGSLFSADERAKALRERITAIERDQHAFAERVAELTARFAPDLAGLRPADAADALVLRFSAAERAFEERARLDEELHTLAAEQERLEREQRQARARLNDLIALAGVAEESELASVEERVRRASELDVEITQAERELRQIAETNGLSFEALCAETHGIDAAELQTRLEALEATLDEINDQREDSKQRLASLQAGLQSYRTETGAEAAQRREASAAEVLEYAHDYARFRVAAYVLRRQIERYREKNQDPIVTRASALFQELTLGSFRELRIGLEQRVLNCVRADGKEVEVEGLSEGTRFQLYFALRLASLERQLDAAGALPLLLDDTFIHFDDERMLAAFRVLGSLARRIQVIYFTHHRHHVELARRALDGAVVEHDLMATETSGQLALRI